MRGEASARCGVVDSRHAPDPCPEAPRATKGAVEHLVSQRRARDRFLGGTWENRLETEAHDGFERQGLQGAAHGNRRRCLLRRHPCEERVEDADDLKACRVGGLGEGELGLEEGGGAGMAVSGSPGRISQTFGNESHPGSLPGGRGAIGKGASIPEEAVAE